MEKAKIGIPVTLLGAIMCLLGYYGGYVVTGIAVGYILLVEENQQLKKMAVKVLAVMLCFSVLSTLLYLIPSFLGVIESLIRLFDSGYYMGDYYRFFEFPNSVLSLLKTILFLLMGVNALQGKQTKVPVVDQLLDKYMK